MTAEPTRQRCLLATMLIVLGMVSVAARADDAQIATKVLQKIKQRQADGAMAGFNISLRVDDGTVWFMGTVSNVDQKKEALALAKDVAGVKKIVDDIKIRGAQVAAAKRGDAVAGARDTGASSAAGADKAGATLRWSNGDTLPGRIAAADETHLTWKSPIFPAPFRLDMSYLNSVEFPLPSGTVTPPDGTQFITRSGDVLYGRLVEATSEQLIIDSVRHGRIQLLVSETNSFRSRDVSSASFVGPNGIAGWRTLSRARRISEWKTLSGGRLSTSKVGAELFRDLKLPRVSEIVISLSWKGKPGFMLTFATPDAVRYSKEVVKLETWDDELVLQTLESNGDFEQLTTLTKNQKQIDLRLLWDQNTGEMRVNTANGRPLGSMSAGQDTGQGLTGIYLQNKGSDLTVESIRVASFDATDEPQRKGDHRVYLASGSIKYGKLLGIDKATGVVKLDTAAGLQSIALREVGGMHFGDTRPADGDLPTRFRFNDGTMLRGKLIRIEGDRAFVRTDYAQEPIATSLRGATLLTFAGASGPVTPASSTGSGRLSAHVQRILRARNTAQSKGAAAMKAGDVILYSGGKLHGMLIAVDQSEQIGWQPIGSANASPLPIGGRVRIVRNIEADAGQVDPATDKYDDVLYLRNGDIIPCRIDLIDEQSLHLSCAFSKPTAIPIQRVKAVEFGADGFVGVNDFGDRGWKLSTAKKEYADKTDDVIVFRGPAQLSHETLMRANNIEFDIKWNESEQVYLMISLFGGRGRGAPAVGPMIGRGAAQPQLMVYMLQQQVLVRGANGRAFQQARAGNKVRKGEARLGINVSKETLSLMLDGKQVFSQKMVDRDRKGDRFHMSVQSMNQQRRVVRNGRVVVEKAEQGKEYLTISNLSVKKTSSRLASPEIESVDEEPILTLPRNRKQNPPTHLLVAKNEDMLRGRLIGLKGDVVRFTSRFEEFSFPRNRLASIVWLGAEQAAEQPTKLSGPTIQALFKSGVAFTLVADKMIDGNIVGRHPLFGECSLPLKSVRELQIGGEPEATKLVAYYAWKLHPAKEPQFASVPAGTEIGDDFGLDSPLVGTAAKNFTLDLLDGSRFSLREHADKIVVLDFLGDLVWTLRSFDAGHHQYRRYVSCR